MNQFLEVDTFFFEPVYYLVMFIIVIIIIMIIYEATTEVTAATDLENYVSFCFSHQFHIENKFACLG